jgi:putative glycosyltransferase (TIGR04372 family)
LVFLIRLISPVYLIRFGTLHSSRIGHFVADSAHQYIKLKGKDKKIKDYYWLDNYVCNKHWEIMVKRNFPIYKWVKYVDIWNHYVPGGDRHYRPSSATASRDIHGLLEKSKTKMMGFMPEEQNIAKEWLRTQGWKDGEPFVCFMVRDSAFLSNVKELDKYDWNYHSYRDSNIDSYIHAMQWLASQGVFVLRMGKEMLNPVQVNNLRIIDYAFSSDKSDLLDIWLFANCNLCVSTGTGPDWISDVYRRPILYLNFLPLMDMISWSDTINYPKKLIWKNTKNMLTLKEYLDHILYRTDEYEKFGIEVVDLNSSEILAVTQEAWKDMSINMEENSDNYLNQQNKFWDIVKDKDLDSNPNYHGFIHPKSRISSVFLEKNKNFLT